MAVLLGSAQPAQTPQIPAAVRGVPAAEGAPGGEKEPAERMNNFYALMNSFQKKQPDSPEKTANKNAASAEEDAQGESVPESLPLPVNPLAQGAEPFMRLVEAVWAELPDCDFLKEIAVSRDLAAGTSRFDPDLILKSDFAYVLQGKKIPDGFVKAGLTEQPLPADPATPAEETDTVDPRIAPDVPEALLNALTPPETEPSPEGEGIPAGQKALEKLAELAKEFLQIAERSNPVLAEQLQNLLQSVREGLSPDELEQAVAVAARILTELGRERESVSDGKEASVGLPAAAEEGAKDAGVSDKAHLPPASDKTEARASDTRQHRGLRASGVKETEHDKGSAKNDFSREIASQLRPSLNETAEDISGARAQALTTPGEPGTAYRLDPNDAFGDGITATLQFLRDEGLTEARIVVEPPALGRIDVSLQAMASGVEAVFKVDNEHLRQVLQQQLDSLKYSLEAQGIHVSGLTVDIRNRDDGRRQDTRDGGKIRRSDRFGEDGSEEDESVRLVRLDLEKGLLHWIA